MTDNFLWWQTGVIYQIYPRSFKDSTGNGVGDLSGIIEKLDYLSSVLQVDTIWLSPFYPSPMKDFGYDVSDYTDVEPLFGDLATFDRLLDEAHSHGLKVVIDFVPNHSSDQHPWFIESRSSRDNPKRNWYIWADAKPDGSPPNNWISNFGGSAWEWDEATGQYYLHSFLKEQPDLNWRNPEARAAMLDAIRFWLERGVDGFRVDVAHYIMKDPAMRDNPPHPDPVGGFHKAMGDYNTQLHINNKGHDDVHQVYREFRRLLDEYSSNQPRCSLGEIHIFDWDEWVTYYGKQNDEFHMPFNFSLLKVPWRADAVRAAVDNLEAALPSGAWPNYVLGNHDEPRIATRYGRENASLAAMLLLTLRGTPTLYYADEIGMVDVPVPMEQMQDPWGIRVPGTSRDPNRTPMQWSADPLAGFSPLGTSTTWLPIAPDYKTVNVETQLADPNSILNLYRRLLTLRRTNPALNCGSYAALDEGVPQDVFAFIREYEGQRVLVALNFSDVKQRVWLPQFGGGYVAINTLLNLEGQINLSDLTLRPHEGVIVLL